MRVILLDDDRNFLKSIDSNLQKLFGSTDIETEIDMAYNILEFEQFLERGAPDLVFLDIDIPDKSGIEIADEIRSKYEGVDIIFLTNREDLVFQSIHYLPFRFIRKSKLNEELKEAVSSYIKYYIDKKVVFEFEFLERKVPLTLSEIIYIESHQHYSKVHTANEIIFTKTNIGMLESEFSKFYFLRIQRSFLVNLKHVIKITGKNVVMTNGEVLTIKRGSMEYIRTCFFEYRRDKLNGSNK